jgi:hypothetical protein
MVMDWASRVGIYLMWHLVSHVSDNPWIYSNIIGYIKQGNIRKFLLTFDFHSEFAIINERRIGILKFESPPGPFSCQGSQQALASQNSKALLYRAFINHWWWRWC